MGHHRDAIRASGAACILKMPRCEPMVLNPMHRRNASGATMPSVKRRLGHTPYSRKRREEKSELRPEVLAYNLFIIARSMTQIG